MHPREYGLEQRTSRIPGLDVKRNKEKRVAVFGTGNLGGRLIEILASLDYRLIIVDSSRVSPENLGYQRLFTKEDLGKFKVEVAHSRLKEVYPWVDVEPVVLEVPYPGCELECLEDRFTRTENILDSCDLVACCFDTFLARLSLFLYSFLKERPFVNIGIENYEACVRTWLPETGYACPACRLRNLSFNDLGNGCRVAHPSIAEIASALGAFHIGRILSGEKPWNISLVSLASGTLRVDFRNIPCDPDCFLCSRRNELCALGKKGLAGVLDWLIQTLGSGVGLSAECSGME